MEITCRFRGGIVVLDLTGRFVVSAGEVEILPLRSAIGALIADGRVLVALNLTHLSSIDARGLGELVRSLTTLRNHGGELGLIAPRAKVRKLLSLTRLEGVFPIFETEWEARCNLRRTETHREASAHAPAPEVEGGSIPNAVRPAVECAAL